MSGSGKGSELLVAGRVNAILVSSFNLDPSSVLPLTPLRDQTANGLTGLGLDAMDVAQLAFALEDEFAVDVRWNAQVAWATVGDVIAWTQRQVGAAA